MAQPEASQARSSNGEEVGQASARSTAHVAVCLSAPSENAWEFSHVKATDAPGGAG